MCGFTYDVFLCAHDELRDWIERVILLPLENDYDPPYKICWHLRDFVTGLPINEQIIDAVYSSRKVVIIFSQRFMDSSYCQLELEYAMYRQLKSKTKCLLPLTLSDKAVPLKMRKKFTYLHVDVTNDDQLPAKLVELLGR